MASTDYPVFYGFAEAWPATWEGAHRQGMDTVMVSVVDAFKVFNLAHITLSRGQETSGARIGAVLDALNWPTELRDIDAGASQVQAAELVNVSALAHIQEVAASESGQFFIAADGTATFFDRFHETILDDALDTWGDETGEKKYAAITTSYDDQTIWNQVVVTAPDLADQTANDLDSQATFGGVSSVPRTLNVSTLLTTEEDMLARAQFLVGKYANPELRVTSMEQATNANFDDATWLRILPKELHDRVLVKKRPEGVTISQPSFIEGMSWTVSSKTWRITWNLSATQLTQGAWQLEIAGRSELDLTTTLVG